MNWTIRRMHPGDIDAVMALAETIPEAPRWRRGAYEIGVAVDESGLIRRAGFIAESEGNLLGFTLGQVVGGICELESIVVAPELRGQGMGRALFAALIAWAQICGASRLELEVRASNDRAIALYRSMGMCREGLRNGYYQAPEEDAVLMGTPLSHGGKLL
jgi:[ribosomal protein S18]-alanine N-acetyltransferase